MKKKILLLGGSNAQLPAIFEAVRRGWNIVLCDYLKDNPGKKYVDKYYNISTTDFRSVLKVAHEERPDFVFAYASDPAAATAAFIGQECGLPSNSFAAISLLSKKDSFRTFLCTKGFNSPKYLVSVSYKELLVSLSKVDFPLIIKPIDSSGSKGVSIVFDSVDLECSFNNALTFSRCKKVIVEEYIEKKGSQLHGDGFALDGELVFLQLGDHHYNKGSFVPYATTWPANISTEVYNRVENELFKAIKLSGFKTGAINVEIRIDTQDNIYIIEIGPRSGGNFVPQAINNNTGFDAIKATYDDFEGNNIVLPACSHDKYYAYYVVHSNVEGVLKEIKISDLLKPFVSDFYQYKNKGDVISLFQGSGAALGVVLLNFQDIEEMNDVFARIKHLVLVELDEEK